MRFRNWNYFPEFEDEGEVIASFGQAKLVKSLDGRYELRGGSKDDRLEAREWISMFCHEVVVREV
jgi:hypothetical protein